MTYFNPVTPSDRLYASWVRRIKLADRVLSSTPLSDDKLWKERLTKWTKLYHEAIAAVPALSRAQWNVFTP